MTANGDSMYKISVIMPVYNAEKHLGEAVESIRKQSMQELEIVCVDDGSTDRSLEMLEKIQKKDKRLKIYSQENRGAGAARNLGLQKAEGEYAAFVDADDRLLDPQSLEKLYAGAKRQKAAVCGGFRQDFNESGCTRNAMFRSEAGQGGCLFRYRDWQMDYDYQNYIFSLDFLRRNKLEFPIYRRFEDPVFFVRAMLLAGQFFIVPVEFYGYRISEKDRLFNEETSYDMLCGITELLHVSRENRLEKLRRKLIERINDEYGSLITYHMAHGGLPFYRKLAEAEALAAPETAGKKTEGSPLYPLQWMQDRLGDYIDGYEKRLRQHIEGQAEIIIYGAGTQGRSLYRFLEKSSLAHKASCFLVSRKRPGQDVFCGKPVYSIDEYRDEDSHEIMIACSAKNYHDITECLKKNGFSKYMTVENAFLIKFG